MRKFFYVFSSLLWLVTHADAAVNLNTTRVVFNAGATQRSVTLSNDGDYPVVVQSWVDDGNPENTPSQARAPFVVLPPVMKLMPGQQREIRVMTTGQGLPQDRESLYWLNVYQIPALPVSATAGEKVRLVLRNQLKVLWRPKAVGRLTEKSINQLTFIRKYGVIYAKNDSMWNITLAEASCGAFSSGGMVVPPWAERPLSALVTAVSGCNTINFTVINDDGNRWGFRAEVN
ncbi:fimbrial biogenesis chaperone [Yokenella regensburgei]|uniref:fimbrial biogenesis chaperone n=1 Tax=Yokenella regensburgei TaxID=158877 RepID=UPI003ED9045E